MRGYRDFVKRGIDGLLHRFHELEMAPHKENG